MIITKLFALFSNDPSVSCGRVLAIGLALEAFVLVVYIEFIRTTPMTPVEERLIEFLAGFAVAAYSGAKAGDTITGGRQ